VDQQQRDGSRGDAGDAAGLAQGGGAHAFEFLQHLGGQPGDAAVVEALRDRRALVALGAGGAVLVEAATGTAERSPAAGAGVCAHAATTSPADAASAATLRRHGARWGVDLLMN